MVSTNTICYQGIMRDYRNAVVQHVRQTLKSKYPDNWHAKLTLPFQKEWDRNRTNAETLRQTGELGGSLEDEFDLLGVNHFYNLFDLYFSDLFPEALNLSEDDRKKKKQAVLGWSGNIKDLRDPVIGHPAEVDVAEEDAYLMLDSARRILTSIDGAATERIVKLRDSVLTGKLNLSGEVILEERTLDGNLPSREIIAPGFIGRQAELGKLNEWLHDPNSRVWLLAGDGGKGKTAIAYEFAAATRGQPPSELEIVIWLSAKARRFVSGQSMDIDSPDFGDLDSALDWVLRLYGSIGFEEMGTSEKEAECLSYLSLLPALIVLDDVDSLEGQNVEAMNFFVHKTHATRSKFLLTSRRVPFGMEPMSTQVTGFEPGHKDGNAFINSRIKMYGLEPGQFTIAIKNSILEACDGSPLFVQDLLRLCTVGVTPGTAIIEWKDRRGEPARRYALGREFEMLSESAKRVLLTCALFPGPVSLPEIEVAAEISEDECYLAIQELQRQFLLPKPSFIENAPRFGLNLNTHQLVIEVHGRTDLANRISSRIQVILGQAEATPEYRTRIGQHIRQAISFVKLDRHSEAEKTLQRALDLYPGNSDLHGSLGWVYKAWNPQPRYTDARNQFVRAAELKSSKEDMYRHWSVMEYGQSEWTSSAEASERGLEVIKPSVQLSFRAGLARSQLSKDLYRQAQYSRADQEAHKAEDHLKAALLDLDEIESGQYQLHSHINRATVINYEYLVRIRQAQQEQGGVEHFLQLLARSLNRWANEHPSDSNASSEKQRLVYWFPSLESHL